MTENSSQKKKIEVEINQIAFLDPINHKNYPNDVKNHNIKKRLDSIDFVKGLAIVMIILSHTSQEWLAEEWLFTYGFAMAFLDIFGPSLFVLLSALSVVFSIKKKEQIISKKIIRNKILFRGITMMLIGTFYNIGKISSEVPFPLSLWGWNIMFFLGFSQIASYFTLKINKIGRIIIGIFIISISPFVRDGIFAGKDSNIIFTVLNFLITSEVPQLPILPWVAICFISTVFGEYLHEMISKGTKDDLFKLFRLFLTSGIIFIIIGITIGFRLLTEVDVERKLYEPIAWLELANSQKFIEFQWPGIPEFLIRGMASNMFYLLGWALLIISISIYYIDIKGKRNNIHKMFFFYGKVSLSLFLLMFPSIYLFHRSLTVYTFFPPFFGLVGLLGFLLYIWLGYFKGIGTPEWILAKVSGLSQKKELKNKNNS